MPHIPAGMAGPFILEPIAEAVLDRKKGGRSAWLDVFRTMSSWRVPQRSYTSTPQYSRVVRNRHGLAPSSDAFVPRLGGPRGSGRLLGLRELIVKFAVAHRSDQNVDDQGHLVQRRNGNCVLALLELNRFQS
jgi:hypothetical protein